MTKYPTLRPFNGKGKFRRSSSWKEHSLQERWKSFIVVFLAIVLVFATINGFLKSISIKKYFGELSWDDSSSFIALLATSPPSLFIYQNDPKRLVLLSVSPNFYFATGELGEPLRKIGDVFKVKNEEELTRIATLNFGTKIEKYVIFDNLLLASKDDADLLFKKFASITTPFSILRGEGGMQTNITRFELLSLWWRLKDLSIDQLKLVDISGMSEEVVRANNQKVLGVDDQALARKIREYLENSKVLASGHKVLIRNAAGSRLALNLAAAMVSSIGFDIAELSEAGSLSEKTVILSSKRNSYEVELLARIFNCDILSSQTEDIVIVLGRDFASLYFR